MRLSVKFILFISSLLFTTIALMVFLNINQNKSFLENEINKKGMTLAQTAAISCLDPFLKKDFATLRRYCDQIADDEDVLSVSILDSNFIVKMNNRIHLLGESWEKKGTAPLSSGEMIRSITLADTIIGYVLISMTDQNIRDELRRLIWKNIFLGIGFTLIGIAFALVMARRITTPLNTLTQYASKVSEGIFQTFNESTSSDEVGILSRAFNLMMTNLKGYIDARTRNERLTMAGKLSTVIAHEIRNPLEPIKGAAIMLRIKNPNDKWINKYTMIIEEEIKILTEFIDNFLNFTKLGEPRYIKGNINTLIAKVKDLSEEYIRQHDNELIVNLNDNIPDSYFDPSQMKQVLMNLILNAVQAMDSGEGKITISSAMETSEFQNDLITISIRDNGPGIDSEILGKLFDPYFTSKYEGTGIGLFISQLIIEKHRGNIIIDSEYGKWTDARIQLPLGDAE